MQKKPIQNREQNNWETKSARVAYENPWIRVEHREVTTPAGTPGIYGVVGFKNKAMGVVPVDDDGNVYLVGQYRYTLGEYSWEIPEGGCPPDEDLLEAAKRELKEETGLLASRWHPVSRIHTSNSVTNEEGFVYLAQGLVQAQSEPEDTEELAVRKLPLQEAVDMVMDGTITDAISMVAILVVARMLGV